MSFPAARPRPPVAIVFESKPGWTPELQRQFLSEPVSVRLSDSWEHLKPLLFSGTVGMLVVSLDSVEGQTLHMLQEIGKTRVVPCFVVTTDQNRSLEWSIRELGIEGFFLEPIPGELLADRIRRRMFSRAIPEESRVSV